MKKQTLLLSWLVLLLANPLKAADLVVGAEAVPHAEILEFVKPALAKEGIKLQVRVFTNGLQENFAVANKEIDANYFQHQPFLDGFNKSKGTQLVSVAPIHVEPFGAYSRKYQQLAQLPQGAVVGIPNDPYGTRLAVVAEKRADPAERPWQHSGNRQGCDCQPAQAADPRARSCNLAAPAATAGSGADQYQLRLASRLAANP